MPAHVAGKRHRVEVSSRPVAAVPPVLVCPIADPREDGAIVRAAAALAQRLHGRLVLVHTQPPPLISVEPQIAYAAPQPDPVRELRLAARRLGRTAADAGAPGSTSIQVGFGDPEKRLLEIAARESAVLIVLGSQRLPARLVADAPCPLLVLPQADGAAAGSTSRDWGREPMAARAGRRDDVSRRSRKERDVTRSILCGVDGSTDARLALRAAAQLSAQLDAGLVVAHVVQTPGGTSRLGAATAAPSDAELDAGRRLLEHVLHEEGLSDVGRRVEHGFPADRLADLADEEAVELIVVGSRGRGAFKAAFLGSVSNDLIGVARCPVLVVPPGAASGGAVGI